MAFGVSVFTYVGFENYVTSTVKQYISRLVRKTCSFLLHAEIKIQ